jgi:hypothetical protein
MVRESAWQSAAWGRATPAESWLAAPGPPETTYITGIGEGDQRS